MLPIENPDMMNPKLVLEENGILNPKREFGKGFTITNLKYMSQFYLVFSKGHALRDQLRNLRTDCMKEIIQH